MTVQDAPPLDSKSDLIRLATVARILDEHQVVWWLDQGTLLGFVREGGFLEWDRDIDLSIWDADLPRNHPVWEQFRAEGFHIVWSPEHAGDFVKLHHLGSGWISRAIELQRYRREGDEAVRYWFHGSRTLLGRIGNRVLKQVRYGVHHEACRRAGANVGRFAPSWRFPGKSPARSIRAAAFSSAAALLPGPILNRVFDFSWSNVITAPPLRAACSVHWFEKFEQRSFGDISLPVPVDSEAYLAFKYGDDWQTPKREWVYWKDDGAVAESA